MMAKEMNGSNIFNLFDINVDTFVHTNVRAALWDYVDKVKRNCNLTKYVLSVFLGLLEL